MTASNFSAASAAVKPWSAAANGADNFVRTVPGCSAISTASGRLRAISIAAVRQI